LVAPPEPREHLLRCLAVERDDRPPPVGGVLAPGDEAVVFELTHELARGGQREAEVARDLAHRPLALGRDVGEHADVPAAEWGVAADELEELRRGPAARPGAPDDPTQELPELAELVAGNIRHVIKVIVR
jgi:hypothetical protein